MNSSDAEALKAHVADLDQQLKVSKALLQRSEDAVKASGEDRQPHVSGLTTSLPIGPSLHNLLLLSDSALPLGSFAYSSGLESFLAHHKSTSHNVANLVLFQKFLNLSIQTVAHTNVPYVLAAFRDPLSLMDLDNDLDASTPCIVARRASIAQGRALLSIWEKAFAEIAKSQFANEGFEAATAIETFSADLKMAAISPQPVTINGHFAPLWGAVTLSLGLNLEEAGYLFLLNHAKAVISAAVRASVMGPYQAQHILARHDTQNLIRRNLERVWFLQPDDAGQVVPTMDLWIGRHEKLYSRIFQT